MTLYSLRDQRNEALSERRDGFASTEKATMAAVLQAKKELTALGLKIQTTIKYWPNRPLAKRWYWEVEEVE